MAEQELIRLAVPERVARRRCRECCAFVLHVVIAGDKRVDVGWRGSLSSSLYWVNGDLYILHLISNDCCSATA
jgi:hypothetical protein